MSKSDGTDFMAQARSLASGTREPYIAWSYLKRWATGKGPVAMKAAMVCFLEQHGSRPESAAIMPEIMRSATMMAPPERKEILEFANQSFSTTSGFSQPKPFLGKTAGPANLPLSGNRPSFSSVLRPKQAPSAPLSGAGERFVATNDIERMTSLRGEVFRVSESLKLPAHAPAQISRESFENVLSAGKGHAIMRSLIGKIRSHGRDEVVSFGSNELGKKAAPERVSRTVKTSIRKVRKKVKPARKSSTASKKAGKPPRRPAKVIKAKARRKSSRSMTGKRMR
jgi:hypothetical protein